MGKNPASALTFICQLYTTKPYHADRPFKYVPELHHHIENFRPFKYVPELHHRMENFSMSQNCTIALKILVCPRIAPSH